MCLIHAMHLTSYILINSYCSVAIASLFGKLQNIFLANYCSDKCFKQLWLTPVNEIVVGHTRKVTCHSFKKVVISGDNVWLALVFTSGSYTLIECRGP